MEAKANSDGKERERVVDLERQWMQEEYEKYNKERKKESTYNISKKKNNN